ncbi:MAG: hypothetical protein E5V25_24525 [Mesorhizobium sp.]|nr:MAG: hypothetical protein E5V25_24525 [Mesorhizobium sp.]
MEPSEIVSAAFVQLPEKRAGLFPGRPWVVYYRWAVRANGKRVVQGMRSFKLKREAVRWVFSICPTANTDDIPF